MTSIRHSTGQGGREFCSAREAFGGIDRIGDRDASMMPMLQKGIHVTADLRLDISECRHAEDIADEPFDLWGTPSLALRPLRRLDDGRLRSGLVRIGEGWSGSAASGDAAMVQAFVLSGELTIDGQRLGPNGFLMLGRDHPRRIVAQIDCELLLVFDRPVGEAAATDRGILLIEDAFAIEPFTPVINGRLLEGFERRVLWLDPATGADTRLLRVPAGFRGGGPNWHPVEEEIFCIEGDIAPDETRPMRGGSFLWNPANSIHGFNEFTESGCLLLEWHDGPWSLTAAPDAVRPARV